MPGPLLSTVPLEGGVAQALAAVPARPGVAQLLGPADRVLLSGRPANLRKWAGSKLGQARVTPGRRPPTDLSPVATAVRFAVTTSGFHQRLAYERLLAGHVPRSARRDLKTAFSLRLDPAERFPRLTVRTADGAPATFGPFRDRSSAGRALSALHKIYPLRPCDYTFEPDPELPLGLACLYAQVRTCAAPCLVRVSEEDYRALAARAARWLASPWERPDDVAAWLPPWVGADAGSRGIAVERVGSGLELYPVRDWTVLDEAVVRTTPEALDEAVRALGWEAPAAAGCDRDWLVAWAAAPGPRGAYLAAPAGAAPGDLASRLRAAVGPAAPGGR